MQFCRFALQRNRAEFCLVVYAADEGAAAIAGFIFHFVYAAVGCLLLCGGVLILLFDRNLTFWSGLFVVGWIVGVLLLLTLCVVAMLWANDGCERWTIARDAVTLERWFGDWLIRRRTIPLPAVKRMSVEIKPIVLRRAKRPVDMGCVEVESDKRKVSGWARLDPAEVPLLQATVQAALRDFGHAGPRDA